MNDLGTVISSDSRSCPPRFRSSKTFVRLRRPKLFTIADILLSSMEYRITDVHRLRLADHLRPLRSFEKNDLLCPNRLLAGSLDIHVTQVLQDPQVAPLPGGTPCRIRRQHSKGVRPRHA